MCLGARLDPWSRFDPDEGMGLGGMKLKSPVGLTKSIGSCRAWYLSLDDMVLLCCRETGQGDQF
jgi:hypothetical protein